MGIRQWARDRGMQDPAPGTMRITSVEQTGGAALVITGVVWAQGLEPTPTQHKVDVPIAKLRAVFAQYDLPVVVDRTDPRRLRFLWDEVPDERQIDLMEAGQVADRMRAGGSVDAAGGVYDVNDAVDVRVVGADGVQDLPPELADLARQVADRVGRMVGDALGAGPDQVVIEPVRRDDEPWDGR